jgi:plasmid stabilization system protein ParE
LKSGFTSERDAGAADRVLDEIARVWGLLATHPKMGRERPDILPGIRSLAVMSWTIF